ncbi:epoxide hydrolase N-terminal domain-containing protein [Subtercola endophyticus]|uniref:epoxide hydrolase N-terminal domain-containing protein n=1 Tax=Subtercola endophyticus TaxID=2895559 RepID=UPI001E2A62F9|nr:epoxide hydrolase N-terminal domain-containing protein [Subtercola endophyticus]UFS60423.1 epoxide hydrolase N-terminal domain-containing protein [Subtercola endophyticus]
MPRFQATIDGLSIHFVHARAAQGPRQPLPLLLNHGWPDSFWRHRQPRQSLSRTRLL